MYPCEVPPPLLHGLLGRTMPHSAYVRPAGLLIVLQDPGTAAATPRTASRPRVQPLGLRTGRTGGAPPSGPLGFALPGSRGPIPDYPLVLTARRVDVSVSLVSPRGRGTCDRPFCPHRAPANRHPTGLGLTTDPEAAPHLHSYHRHADGKGLGLV